MQLKSKIKVVVAEDEAVIRRGIVQTVGQLDPEFTVAADVGDGKEALRAIAAAKPELLITDIKMPELDGIALIAQARRAYPNIRIVVLSGYADYEYLHQAIRCGVSDYLLKPIDTAAFAEILQDVKNAVLREQYDQTNTVRYSPNFRCAAGPDDRLCLIALCIGNLWSDAAAPQLAGGAEKAESADWDALLQKTAPAGADWYVSDGEQPNEKLIGIRLKGGQEAQFPQLARQLRTSVQELLGGLPVSAAYSAAPCREDDLWLCARRLQNLLHQRVVPAKSSVFVLEEDEFPHSSEYLDIVKLRVNNQLRQCLQEGNRAGIRQELTLIVEFMVNHSVSQRDMQKIVVYVLRMCEFSSFPADDIAISRILLFLCTAYDEKQLARGLVDAMAQSLWPDEAPDDLVTELVAYVDRQYLQLERMEDITKVFHYSYAHLSRSFKKQTGVALNRYVLEKKLELARQLIENNAGMSMSQVAELSGFQDHRYFLRSFKAYTGQSPGEYRSSVVLKG